MALSARGIVNTVTDFVKNVSSSINRAGATGRYNNTDFSGATSKAYDAGLTNKKNSSATTQSGIGNTAKAIKANTSSSTRTASTGAKKAAAKSVGLAADSGTPTKSVFSDAKTTRKIVESTASIIADALTNTLTPYNFEPLISALRTYKPKSVQRPEAFNDTPKSYISTTHDPYEINSIADAVLTAVAPMDLKYNRSAATHALAKDIAYLERDSASLAERIQAVAKRVELANLQVMHDVVFDKTWRPLIERAKDGDAGLGIKESFLNTLTNLGETFDITALAMKPLFTGALEAEIGGNGYTKGELGGKYKRVYTTPKDYYLAPASKEVDPFIKAIGERYKNALGFGDSGRHNYDYEFDTGSKIADSLLNLTGEVLSDPMNLVEALGKKAVTKVVNSTIDDAVKNLDTVVKGAAKDASDEAVEELIKIVGDSFEQARKVYTRDLFNKNIKFSDVFNDIIIQKAYKHADLFGSGIGNDIIIAAKTVAAAAQDSLAKSVAVPLTALLKGWDDVQTAALKGIFMSTPGGLATAGVVKAAKNTIKAINANKAAVQLNEALKDTVDVSRIAATVRRFKASDKLIDAMSSTGVERAHFVEEAVMDQLDVFLRKTITDAKSIIEFCRKNSFPTEDTKLMLDVWAREMAFADSELKDLAVKGIQDYIDFLKTSGNAELISLAIDLDIMTAEAIGKRYAVKGISELRTNLKEAGFTLIPTNDAAYTPVGDGITYKLQRSYAKEFKDSYAAISGLLGFKETPEILAALGRNTELLSKLYELRKNVRIYQNFEVLLEDVSTSDAVRLSVYDTALKFHDTRVTQLLRANAQARQNFYKDYFKELSINLYNRVGHKVELSEIERTSIENLLDSLIKMRTDDWTALQQAQSYNLLPRLSVDDVAVLRDAYYRLYKEVPDTAAILQDAADSLTKSILRTRVESNAYAGLIGFVTTKGATNADSIATFCFKNAPDVSVHKAIVDSDVIRVYNPKVLSQQMSTLEASRYSMYVSRILREANAVKNTEYFLQENIDSAIEVVYSALTSVAAQRVADNIDTMSQDVMFNLVQAPFNINMKTLTAPEQYAALHVYMSDLFTEAAEAAHWLSRNKNKKDFIESLAAIDSTPLSRTVRQFEDIDFVLGTLAKEKGVSHKAASDMFYSIATGYAFRAPIVDPRPSTAAVIKNYESFSETVRATNDRVSVLHSVLEALDKCTVSAKLGYTREYEMLSNLQKIQEKAAKMFVDDVYGGGAAVLRDAAEYRRTYLMRKVLYMSKEDLYNYVVNQGRGCVVLTMPSRVINWRNSAEGIKAMEVTEGIIQHTGHIPRDTAAGDYIKLQQAMRYKSNANVDGLVIHHVKEHIDKYGRIVPDRLYIGLSKDTDVSKLSFKMSSEGSEKLRYTLSPNRKHTKYEYAAEAYAEEVSNELSKWSGGASDMSTGAVMNAEKAEQIFSALPAEFTQNILSVSDLAAAGAYKGVVFDGTLLCDYTYAKELCRDSNRLVVDDMVQSINYLARAQDAVTTFKNAFFAEGSMFRAKNLFYGIPTDSAIEAIRSNPDAIPVRLVHNARSKTGMEVVKTTIEHAFDDDVLLVSRNQLVQMGKVINDFEIHNPFIKFFNKCIMSPLKASYLQTFGMVARNVLGALQQNTATSHTFIDAPAWKQAYAQAYRAYGKYHDWFVYALEASKELGGKSITQEGFAKMCADLGLSKADITLYRAVNNFMNSAASGGLLEEAMAVFKGTAKNRDAIDKLSDTLNTAVWNYTLMGRITKPLNSYVEQINRLAKYFYELSYGSSVETALGEVIKAQYNYDKISETAMYLDIVIPFSGFLISNAKLWADLVSENPWAIRLSLDAFDAMSVYDDRETSPMDLSNNSSLMYNALVGNPVLDNGMTIKMSNTMVEAMKIAMMPFTSISGSLAAPLAMPIDWAKATINGTPWTADEWKAQLSQLIPVYGTWAMRYNPATQYTTFTDEGKTVIVPRGSVLKAAQRLGMELPFTEEDSNSQRLLGLADPKVWSNWDASQTLVMLFPSLFGSTTRKYYFTYDGLKMYSTKDESTYLEHLADGAQAVYTQKDYDNAFKAYKNIVRFAYQFEGGEVVVTDDYNRYLDAVSRGAATVPYTQDELFAKVIAQRVENMRPDEGPAKYAYQYSEGGKIYYTANKDTYDEAIAGGALSVDMTVQEIAALKAAWEQTCKENPVYVFYYEGLRYTTGSEELYNKYIAEGAVAGAEDEYKKYIYGFTYGDKVLATTDPAKFKQHLEKGAEAVALTDAEIDSIYAQWNRFYSADSTPTQQKSYKKKSYKRTYTRSYKGYRSRAYNTYTRTNYNQYNNPSYWRTANASRAKPYRSVTHFYDVYNQVYTRRHSDKFKARMLSFGKTSTGLPLLKSKLRYYIRL